jgi:hypothetical protein
MQSMSNSSHAEPPQFDKLGYSTFTPRAWQQSNVVLLSEQGRGPELFL